MSVALDIASLALRRSPSAERATMPTLDFAVDSTLGEYGCLTIAEADREGARDLLTWAFTWCVEHYPLSIGRVPDRISGQTIDRIMVGASPRPGEILSASSPHAPGRILMAVPFPLSSSHRLASLIAHEAMHQALFVRELVDSPVRAEALGYSPWKGRLRPGRLVWHAYWTFAAQFVLLADALRDDCRLLADDPSLPQFLADMAARILLCQEVLDERSIVRRNEARACADARDIVTDLIAELAGHPAFSPAFSAAEEQVNREYRAWAKRLLKGGGMAA